MRRVAWFVLLAFLLGADSGLSGSPALAAGSIVVTSTADTAGTCPHPTQCTLRAAIQAVNDGSDGDPATISFAPGIFEPEAPGVIEIGTTPLPALSRAGGVIDATGRGVVLRRAGVSISGSHDGLRLTGAGATVLGLTIEGFGGTCLAASGEGARIGGPGAGNRFVDCGVAVLADGPGAQVEGNVITVSSPNDTQRVGVAVTASNVQVGGPPGSGRGNIISGPSVGVRIAGPAAPPVTGVTVEGNELRDGDGPGQAMERCIELSGAVGPALVRLNAVGPCGAGVVLTPAEEDSRAPRGVTIRSNEFSGLRGPAIDLGADGAGTPGSAEPPGPNDWAQAPNITRAVGTAVEGSACAGCLIELYLAFHTPGGVGDYGTVSLGSPVPADESGRFSAAVAGLSPGQWLVATATDSQGNTSEFSAPARVGAGAIPCGAMMLRPGWNHVAYFGAQPLALGNSFPPGQPGAVTAIYRYVDGTGGYERWLAGTTIGRTLTALEPGEEYWVLATAPATVEGGFSVSFPVPVALQAGWNDFTYLGASADPRDALASLAGRVRTLARWDADRQAWLRYGNETIPAWAQELTEVTACAVYQIEVAEPATLAPLQP
ncbi:CSLREA domain-containing protein [Tepidiforma sp.]|uniref:CSLREA domain-containing protein n=1 Tax=Tepidiforma sp. TaxID=2682230 RepID=UPI002ADDFA51|nr:CSLREA domain-containing protein [Tepidiforma sp.]